MHLTNFYVLVDTETKQIIDEFDEDTIDASMPSIDSDLPGVCMFPSVQSVIQTDDASIVQGTRPQNSDEGKRESKLKLNSWKATRLGKS